MLLGMTNRVYHIFDIREKTLLLSKAFTSCLDCCIVAKSSPIVLTFR
jgi:hypothetical protein